MIIVTHRATRRTGSDAALEKMRAEYRDRSCVALPGFIDPPLLRDLRALLGQAVFRERVHPGVSVEQCAEPGALTAALELALNDRDLFSLVSEITGCGRIGCFEGRVYRMLPGPRHADSWHSDAIETRVVAMSINLGQHATAPLQIRRVDSPTVMCEEVNAKPGDATLFRIDPAYVHRVGPHSHGAPRTACAGWFRTRPDFRLAERPARGRRRPGGTA